MTIQENEFTYCPKCAGTFEQKAEHILKCSGCGFEYYINPKPCTGMIIEDSKGDILLVKRKREPQKGWWDLPGGFIDNNESAEDSVVREAKEELGITVNNVQYFMSTADVYEFQQVEYKTICFIYTAEILHGELRPNDDVSEYAFVAKEKFELDRIAFAGLRKALKVYLERNN